MPKIGDKVRFHFIHTHVSRKDENEAVVHDPVWRVREAVIVGINEDRTVDLDVTFLPEDFEDGSNPAKRQTWVAEADGEPKSGQYTSAAKSSSKRSKAS